MSQSSDECKSQWYAAKISRQSRKTHQDVTQPSWRFSDGDGVGDKKAHHSTNNRCNNAYFQADGIRSENISIRKYAHDIGKCVMALLILKRSNKKVGRG